MTCPFASGHYAIKDMVLSDTLLPDTLVKLLPGMSRIKFTLELLTRSSKRRPLFAYAKVIMILKCIKKLRARSH